MSRIYITHGHGDHWLGLARLTERFPGAEGLATSEVLASVEFEAGPGIVARMVELYPDWQNLRTLWHSSRVAIKRKALGSQ